MITIEEIRKRLCESIKYSGKTQIEIAKNVGVSQSAIAHYLHGDKIPTLDTLANICKYLDVSPSYILGYDKSEI